MSVVTFNPITYGDLSFTNLVLNEVDTGTVSPLTGSTNQPVGVATTLGDGISWAGYSAGPIYYANSSEVLNFSYSVTSAAGSLIDSMSQLYVVDHLSGPGVSLVAVEKVYSTDGVLLGTETFVGGQLTPGPVTLSQAQQTINVQITVTMSIDATGTGNSLVTASQFEQTYGTIPGSPPPATAALGDIVWFDSPGSGLETGFNSGPGVAGVTVELLNGTGTSVLATTTTDSSGLYHFTGLQAGVYEVEFISPTGYSFTTQGVGGSGNAPINSSPNQTTGITGPITLTAGQIDNNVEAGLVKAGSGAGSPAALGDTVWLDVNRNGLQDNGETGVAGVTVELLNGTGTSVLATTTTNSSGVYGFSNLTPGVYEVEFIAPTGDMFTTQTVGSNGAIDSNANVSTGITAPVTLTAGQTDNSIDAGLQVLPAALGDYVWMDANKNGVQDSTEAGVAGVTVELLNSTGTSVLATTTTNTSGYYAFTGLNAGTYEVEFVAPTGDKFTTQTVGSNGAIDSNANVSTGITAPVTLTAGQTDNSIDAGLQVLPAALGDYVWMDANKNGVQDSTEAGVAGVTVELLNSTGTSVLATTTTNTSGYYAFTGLNAGTYEVEFIAPTGDKFTTQTVGSNGAIDSNANVSTGITAPVTLTAGQTDNSIDAGLQVLPAALGDYVWMDANKNGVQDSTEAGVAGVTVELLNSTGTSVLATTTTNTSGYYAFTGLNPGSYEVEFIAPTGDKFTTQTVGSNGAIDSNANVSTGITAPVTLTAGQTDNSIDAGLQVLPAALGDYVWLDANKNGLQDSTETGVAGVTVELLNSTGASVLATTTTNTSGYYAFTGLAAGSYEVEFIAPTGDTFTTQTVGSNGAIDSNANVSTGITAPVTLTAGQTDNSIDAGLQVLPAALGDYVWLDANKNGLQDSTETGVAGVTVELLNSTGTSVLTTTTTNTSGYYAFTGLAAGSYEVEFIAPTGDTFTTQTVGSNGAIDSNANVSTGITAPVTLTAGQTDNSIDAGLQVLPAALGDYVWLDANKNGLQDSTETGVAGVTVELLNSTGASVLATTTTNTSGYYAFTGLAAGSYEVEFIAPTGDTFTTQTVGSNGAIDSNANVSTGITAPVTLTAGQTDNSIDAGLQVLPAALGDYVWLDANKNGLQDSTETGVAGVTVELLNSTGPSVLATTTTNTSGYYAFTGLAAGSYEVEFIAPTGDTFTTQTVGSNGAIDSNANVSTGITAPVTLTAGQTDNSIDAGLQVLPAALGDYVWLDANKNGLQDSTEIGVAGVTVELLNSTGASVLATTTTNTSGYYAFTGLNAGTYEVEFIAPMGDKFTTQTVGSNGAIDSNANVSTGITAPVTLTAGQTDNSIDAGLQVLPAALGDYVWMDTDRDGIQDSNETGVAGVTVELLNSTGPSVLATTTTNTSGYYAFTGLAAGSYEVEFIAPTGDTFTTQTVGSNGAIDSNANVSTGITAPVTLTAGQTDNSIDAGLQVLPAALGDYVWLDANKNGLQDSTEIGVAGVTVELLNSTGASVLATTTTNTSGYYAFTGLNAGTYEVEFIAPMGDKFTTQTVGSNGAIDSNANVSTGITAPVTLTAGQTDNSIDAGLQVKPVALAALGNYVWMDTDRDGIQDGTETGVAGVTVELLNSTGTSVLGTTTTNSSGYYAFTGLAAGVYEVEFIAPTGDAFTLQNAGTDRTVDSNANTSTGITAPVTLTAGQTDNTIDAGLKVVCALGDYVWQDLNRNGLQTTGEPGVSGVKVSLLAADTLVLKISEDYYQANAQYTVTVNGEQIGGTYTATALHSSSQDNVITLQGDFGTNPTVVVTFLNDAYGGTASTDRNLYVDGISYNGVVETASAELASSGAKSFGLTGAGGIVLATTTTNSSGYYSFTGLNPGSYEVAFTAPVGQAFTTQYSGTNAAIDSNADQTTGVTDVVTLTAGQTDNTIDAGLVKSSGITVLKQPCAVVVNQCGQVTYSFAVTNTGSSPLTNVKITDNIGSAAHPDNVTPTAVTSGGFNVGDANHNSILDSGETWQYTETVSQINCTPGGSGSVCHTPTGGYLSAGCTAWLHSSFNPTSCADGAHYKFQGVSCTISGGGVGSTPINVTCPDSEVVFSRNCTTATTVYNASTNCWVTTLPANCNPGSVFLTGCPVTIPSGCNLTNSSVTWSVGDASNNCGASSLTWDGGCTGYQSFNQNGCNGLSDYNQIGVKSCDNQSGYGSGGSCNVGYGYNSGSGYCDYGYNGYGGGCGGGWNTSGWNGSSSDNCGTPENLFTNYNCGNTNSCNNYSYGNSCGTTTTACQNTTNIAGAADTVTVTAQTVTGESCTTNTACGTHLTSGCTAWLSTTFKPTSCADGASYSFKGVKCQISGGGLGSPITIACPDSQVVFSKSCTVPTTVFNASTNCWVTTLPANCSPGGVFVTGCPTTIPSGCNLSNAQVTWSVGSSTNNCGASTVNWDGNCTGFTGFNQNGCDGYGNYNNIGVKSCDNLGSNTNGASSAGAPCLQYSSSNCGYTSNCTTVADYTNTCGTTCTVTSTGATVTATDTKEVQVLGVNSNISVNGTATTASLSATYGTAQTLEFTYTPGDTVSLKQVQAGMATVSGTNGGSLAFMEISNNANPFASAASIYFQGEVTTGEKIFADATTNVLTNTPVAGGHFSTTTGADIYAYVFASQQAFQSGAAPLQTMVYNTSGSQAMHFGDTIGSLSVIGYVGATGGHLVS